VPPWHAAGLLYFFYITGNELKTGYSSTLQITNYVSSKMEI
jgi:hypothetical protein